MLDCRLYVNSNGVGSKLKGGSDFIINFDNKKRIIFFYLVLMFINGS